MRFKIILPILLFSIGSFAQITVGQSYGGFDELSKKDYVEIANRTTVFVINDFDLKQFEEMLGTFWDINKFIVVSPEQYETEKEKYMDIKYATFKFINYTVTLRREPSMSIQHNGRPIYFCYDYSYYEDIKTNKKGIKEGKLNQLSSIVFIADETEMWAMNEKKLSKLDKKFYNYKLGFIKNYLQFINLKIKSKESFDRYKSQYEKDKIKVLAKETLYVPDFIMQKYAVMKNEKGKSEDTGKLFEDYNYKFEVIITEALNNKILTAKEDFYYLMFSLSNDTKVTNVVNGKTGEIIYNGHEFMKGSINSDDISDLNKKIKK